jgi:hypothetical protein
MTEKHFLKLPSRDLDRYLKINPEATYNNAPGFGGTIPTGAYVIMKEDLASVKHGTRDGLTAFQKNMMLIPDDMILAADDDHPSFPVMRDIWTR